MAGDRKHRGRSGLVPLARNSAVWNSAGFAVLKWSVVCFTVLGFAAGFAAISNGGAITLNGRVIEGWVGVWTITSLCSVAGALFGLIWVLIFKALALVSKG